MSVTVLSVMCLLAVDPYDVFGAPVPLEVVIRTVPAAHRLRGDNPVCPRCWMRPGVRGLPVARVERMYFDHDGSHPLQSFPGSPALEPAFIAGAAFYQQSFRPQ